MSITTSLKQAASIALEALYQYQLPAENILINQTKPEFKGDYTIVLFSFVKELKKSPDQLGQELGDWLMANEPGLVSGFNIIKGFLNLNIADSYWTGFLQQEHANPQIGRQVANGQKVMIEYASPNTNKPLHLGHLRNIFLGWSVAEIFRACGYEVVKTCIVNDRGIHICKSMITWQLFGKNATPQDTNTKGDHFVGEYYVKFNDEYKRQVQELLDAGSAKNIAEKEAPIMKAAQQMLLGWESGKPEVMALWREMNEWVYEGFDTTYKRIGTDFDKVYYESNTYLLGREAVKVGLEKGVFFKKEDGSVWIDLTADGLDEKLVMRKDGTSVYITQDIGLAMQKYEQYGMNKSIYVIGDEQNYHMKVLQLICKKLHLAYADGIYHLSYGMVELPTGRMKSREGTVVDADDIVDEMEKVAQQKTEELGKVKDFTGDELTQLYTTLGLGALKFYLLRVEPKKKMVFNPEESIDFHGFTAPFVQYTHARIKSVFRKVGETTSEALNPNSGLLKLERDLIVLLEQYGSVIEQACSEMNPSLLALYVFNLAKTFNSFFAEHSIANAETEEKKQLRLMISQATAGVIASGMQLMGITVPERM
ncbi:MAG: arginine--tRNA ligase [Chitinophagaceae bacterium]